MDNICHTLVGATLSRAGFDRRTPLATATMVIGANLPDVDVIAVPFGVQLSVRRGITHGIPALIILPLVLTGAMMLWDRHVRRRRNPSAPPVVARQVLIAAAIAILTHPFLDWMNTYGMRWFMPFVDRWYYADTLFIVDPWLWLALGAGYVWSRRGGGVHAARIALAASALYIALMMAGTLTVRWKVILDRGEPMPLLSRQLMVAPVPINPFVRQVVLADRGLYRVGTYSFIDGRFRMTESIPINRRDPAIAAALRDPDIQRFMHWARFPFFTVERNGSQAVVHIGDARYSSTIRRMGVGVHRRSIAVASDVPCTMNLPVSPPILPMLAKRVSELPPGDGWIFEPKWDGFRALIFRDGDDLFIQSRDEKPLDRYFPEVVEALKAQLPPRCALDGELVIARDGALDFEALQMRLHPAASRVKKLAGELPASVVFFDLLCEGDQDLRPTPFANRRARLESLLSGIASPLHVTPATTDRELAADWFKRFEGAGLDGVVAKHASGLYEPNKRVMLKVKHERDCDCVVAGFRWHKNGQGTAVGSLLLGLYDGDRLEHVGVCASFTDAKRRELVEFLTPYRENALENHPWKAWASIEEEAHRRPGAGSRWSAGKDLSWEPVRPELVVEVAYDHMQGSRFRHTAQFRRWRTDKRPTDCTFDQLEVVPPQEIAEIFT